MTSLSFKTLTLPDTDIRVDVYYEIIKGSRGTRDIAPEADRVEVIKVVDPEGKEITEGRICFDPDWGEDEDDASFICYRGQSIKYYCQSQLEMILSEL
jgi:hypothetical protein